MFRKAAQLIHADGIRLYHPSLIPTLRAMRSREKLAGGPKLPQRSAFVEWDLERELKIFNKRFGLVTNDSVKNAFFTSQYIDAENERREELTLTKLDVESNELMAARGLEEMSKILDGQIKETYPLLPSKAVMSIRKFLCDAEQLERTANELGLAPFIKREGYGNSVSPSMLRDALLAYFDAIENKDVFCRRYILVRLVGEDLVDLWNPLDPKGELNALLKSKGMGSFEPRIIGEAGRNTFMESIFYVGIYSDKKMIGKAANATQSSAVVMAVRDALRRMYKVSPSDRSPFERMSVQCLTARAEACKLAPV